MSGSETDPVKKKRSPVERIIVQGGIVVLLIIVAIEFRAQKGYTDTLEKIRIATEDGEKEISLEEVTGLLTLSPSSFLESENGIESTTCYSWFSVFKNGQFKLNIVATKTEPRQMLRYFTGSDGDPMTVKPPTEISAAPTPEERKRLMQGGGGGGGAPKQNSPPPEDAAKSEESTVESGSEVTPPTEEESKSE